MSEEMRINKEELESRGFEVQSYLAGKAWVKRIAPNTVLRFGGQFNGALELELPDGNEGFIILVPDIESWADVETLARIFARTWIDTGHTLTSNFDETETP